MPATSGAVTRCAAQATASASASGLGQPLAASRRDHGGAITTNAAVAITDSANPTSTASCGATASNTTTVADRAGMACRRRDDSIPVNAMAPITAARNTLAVGCTTTTNPASPSAANTTAARGPINRAENSTAAHTIVTLAPETAIKCVMPDARNSRLVSRGHRRGVTEHQGGQHRRLLGRQCVANGGGESTAHRVRGPLRGTRGAHGRPARRVEHRDRQVTAGRTGDAGSEPHRLADHHSTEVGGAGENDDPTRYLLGAQPLQGGPEHQPAGA